MKRKQERKSEENKQEDNKQVTTRLDLHPRSFIPIFLSLTTNVTIIYRTITRRNPYDGKIYETSRKREDQKEKKRRRTYVHAYNHMDTVSQEDVGHNKTLCLISFC